MRPWTGLDLVVVRLAFLEQWRHQLPAEHFYRAQKKNPCIGHLITLPVPLYMYTGCFNLLTIENKL